MGRFIWVIIILWSINVYSQKHFVITDVFNETKVPPKPSYNELKFWASHPGKKDMADLLPKNNKGLKDYQSEALADVFFIYPTIYTFKPVNQYTWNASAEDQELNQKIEKSSIFNQATIFNGITKVYAPFYRQAHYSVFTSKDQESAQKAIDLAYEDVKQAFLYYMKTYNKNRPIVIAAHSQGTLHAVRLLKEFFDGKEQQQKLIAAYLVGMPVNDNMFSDLKIMNLPDDTGGYVSWNTFSEDYFPDYYQNGLNKAQCVNPVTWTTDTTWSKLSHHRGTLGLKAKLSPQIVKCKVEEGVLWIKKPQVPGKAFLKEKIWHFADYNLFWLDVRENVALRTNQYFSNKDSK